MTIQKISVANFTVFEDLEIDLCDGINIFIGENGTGKTHLLKLLYAVALLHENGNLPLLSDLFGKDFVIHGGCSVEINSKPATIWPLSIAYAGFPDENGNIPIPPPQCTIKAKLDTKNTPVFIPAKELLSMAKIFWVAEDYKKAMNLDITLVNIIKKAESILPDNIPPLAAKLAHRLETVIGGTVEYDEKEKMFWVSKDDGINVPFTSEAEGYKKLGLLWRLIMNKEIKEDTVLLWDEPEANLNPALIPVLVETMLELSRNGVQIILATHDYNLMKYFSVKKQSGDDVAFFSLYKQKSGSVACERENDYDLLAHNAIIDANTQLIEDDLEDL